MKRFPVHPILWSSLLVLCASLSETLDDHPDVCRDEKDAGNTHLHSPPGQQRHVERATLNNNFRCLLYPTNILNCSWSLLTLHKDAQLFAEISICDGEREVHTANLSSEERAGSMSLMMREHEELYVILHFNISLHAEWTVYSSAYDVQTLEVLSPPPNISASLRDGGLLVAWGLPRSREYTNPSCFEYQLEVGDQGKTKNLSDQLSYTEPNADPAATYRVRMRTKKSHACQESSQWSDWSRTVTVEQSVYQVNPLVIASISLGIPMILLAVLLRHQRVVRVLFPPIPRPPAKYKVYLEKNDPFSLFWAAPPAEPVEEITVVEDAEPRP